MPPWQEHLSPCYLGDDALFTGLECVAVAYATHPYLVHSGKENHCPMTSSMSIGIGLGFRLARTAAIR